MLKSQNLKVTELKAEFFPPKEDVVLQNESPTEFYIMVVGAAVRYSLSLSLSLSLSHLISIYSIMYKHGKL